MKTLTEYLWFERKQCRELVRLTDDVERLVKKSGIAEGMALVSAMHITAGVFVNDDEPGLFEDIWKWLDRSRDQRRPRSRPLAAGVLCRVRWPTA